ncbi:MAG: DEAD/DEAH box helicase [Tenericutes bacterium HGW-Tenericutes-3]|nr:MAG: DEAD/DEAH box helicase [Tenericutes bacterium HGW-Tenericutes-3]
MTFKSLEIIEPILKSLEHEGYLEPSPIQEQAIPVLLEGKDILGSAQTGTGKTAAFAIPILQGLYKKQNKHETRYVKALVLAPTRELASQIKDSFVTYGKHLGLKTAVIFGGVSQKPQTEALRKGIDILVATPGRLLDLANQGFIDFTKLEYFVLDEADRMLDMGFVKDVERIIKLIPKKRQTMLFSATMPKEIITLSKSILNDPVRIAVKPVESTLEVIDQSVYHVAKKDKIEMLIYLLKHQNIDSALVFTRTKAWANKVTKALVAAEIKAEAIHGNKSQNAREKALGNFKSKQIKVLIATDIAARGIDIDELSHVINYDLPEVPETYIHRIGRTGRAGFSGVAISFCSQEESPLLRAIEKHIQLSLKVEKPIYFTQKPKEKKYTDPAQRSQKKMEPKQSYQVKAMNKGPEKKVETESKHQNPYHAKKKKYWDKQLKDRYKSKQK